MMVKEMTLASSIIRSIPLGGRRAGVKTLGMPAVFAVALVAIGLVSMLYLAQTSAVATAGYDIKRLEDQKTQSLNRNAQLRVRIAQLKSLERIDEEARARLKMGPPTRILYVPVDPQAVASEARQLASSPGGVNSDGKKSSAEENKASSKGETSWLAALLELIGR